MKILQKIAIKDQQLKNNFGIEIMSVVEDNGTITLGFYGNGHRDIVIRTKPLENVGSGTITDQDLFDDRVNELEKLHEKWMAADLALAV